MQKILASIEWYLGCSRDNAMKFLCNHLEKEPSLIDEIVLAFEENAKKAFYDD